MSPCLPPGDEGVSVEAVAGRMLRSPLRWYGCGLF